MLRAQTKLLNVSPHEPHLLWESVVVHESRSNHPPKYKCSSLTQPIIAVISRAFQVLSDTDKRATFDRHGTDPDSRGTTDIPRGGSQFGFAPTPARFEGEISPEDLFNMFFGGMGPGGGGGGIFGDGAAGGFTTFAGPNIRVHQFGGQRRRRPAQAAAPGTQEEQTQTSLSKILIQLLPLIIFFILPILGSLFTGDSTPRGPGFKMDRTPPFTMQRETPNFKIPFWVNPSEVKDLKKSEIAKLDKGAETHIINGLNYQCTKELELQQNEANEAQGWFFVDQVRMDKARKMPMPSCQRLNELGARRRSY